MAHGTAMYMWATGIAVIDVTHHGATCMHHCSLLHQYMIFGSIFFVVWSTWAIGLVYIMHAAR
jgi:hypothetical protein